MAAVFRTLSRSTLEDYDGEAIVWQMADVIARGTPREVYEPPTGWNERTPRCRRGIYQAGPGRDQKLDILLRWRRFRSSHRARLGRAWSTLRLAAPMEITRISSAAE